MEVPSCLAPVSAPAALFRRRGLDLAWTWLGILLAFHVCAVLGYLVHASDVSAEQGSNSRPVEMALGRSDAPITVVEYFSFSCSHCARFHRETFPKLKRDFVDTGKVRFVARDFPLNLAALTAAGLARCVGPERYFETVDILWDRWDDWINRTDPNPALISVLRSEGIDGAVLERCQNDRSFEDQALNSYIDGARNHSVDRTPTFLINGRKYVGLTSYRRFAAILDTLLEQSRAIPVEHEPDAALS